MVTLAREMLNQILRCRFGLYNSAPDSAGRGENIPDKILHFMTEPLPDRYTESHLSPVNSFARDKPCGHLFEERFRFEPSHFQMLRQAGRKFDHVVIEK